MYIEILKHEEVEANHNYITCEAGEFAEYDFVLCKEIRDIKDNTVMFLAAQIINK